jgi:hypothetical protein
MLCITSYTSQPPGMQLSSDGLVPHSPSPSQKLPTVAELEAQCGVPVESPFGHSDAATARRQFPPHASWPLGHAYGGNAGDGGSGGGGRGGLG